MSEEAVTRSQGGGVQDGSAGNLVGAASGEIYGIGCRIPPPHPETAGEISVAGGGACRPPTEKRVEEVVPCRRCRTTIDN